MLLTRRGTSTNKFTRVKLSIHVLTHIYLYEIFFLFFFISKYVQFYRNVEIVFYIIIYIPEGRKNFQSFLSCRERDRAQLF